MNDTLPPGIAVAGTAQISAAVVEKVSRERRVSETLDRFVDPATGHARETGGRMSASALEC